MKKITAVFLILTIFAFSLCLSSCGGGEPANDKTKTGTASAAASETAEPGSDVYAPHDGQQTYLSSPSATVKAGETAVVTLHMGGFRNVACFDADFTCSGGEIKEISDLDSCGAYSEKNFVDGVFRYYVFVVTTFDIPGNDFAELSVEIPADAQPGDEITVSVEFSHFTVGTDESGDKTEPAEVPGDTITLTVE